jgi:hypothetical protein
MAYRERVYRDDPVIVERQAAPTYMDSTTGWTGYAFVKYAFILAITIVILYFVARYIIPLINPNA